MKPVLCRPLLAACLLAMSASASAMPIVESGKTVERADFSLNFDIMFSGVDLETYEENGIFVTTPGAAYVGSPLFVGDDRALGFHYAAMGNLSYTAIRGVNAEVFGAVAFLLGNGWAMPTNHMRYATYRNGMETGTGVAVLKSGIVRISDLGGFDELRLNAHYAGAVEFGEMQAVALDDMHVQLWSPASAVPEPGQLILFGAGLLALNAARSRLPRADPGA